MQINRWDVGAIILTIIILFCLIVFKYNLLDFNRKDISFYYDLLKKQEEVKDGVKITDEDLQELKACKNLSTPDSYNSTRECIKKFYEKYTLRYGVNKAFSHLALLQDTYANYDQDCHSISHGIGHAQLQLEKGNIGKALAAMTYGSYYKNLAICGNGYFHGVIEQYAKDEKTKEGLVKMLQPVCENFKNTTIPIGNCFHGVGHAAYIQLDYNMDDALWVCENISKTLTYQDYCADGLFMEAAQDLPLDVKIKVTDGKFDLIACNSLGDKFKSACYGKMTVLLEKFAKDPNDHANNIKYCKQITDPLLRMTCVRLIASSAVSQNRYAEIKDMCVNNTSTRAERIICTAVTASKVARGLDSTMKKKVFTEATHDICGYLSYFEAKECEKLVKINSIYLYLPRIKSLDI